VHGSLLPDFRGAAPIAAAILAGEESTGVTLMLMNAGMDTGPILSQRECPIEAQDTTGTLSVKLATLGAQLLADTLPLWLAGEVQPRPQLDERATYAPPIRKDDRRVDWRLPAEQLARRVRAFQPWPGTMTFWQGKPLKLLKVQPLAASAGDGEPGRVITWEDGVAVVTGEGLLLLTEVQLAGGRALPVTDFLRGHRGFLGSLLRDA
jgi:methionyl-tRNA formyltransferase